MLQQSHPSQRAACPLAAPAEPWREAQRRAPIPLQTTTGPVCEAESLQFSYYTSERLEPALRVLVPSPQLAKNHVSVPIGMMNVVQDNLARLGCAVDFNISKVH